MVTTSYPREPGDYAGSFVATTVAALRAPGGTILIFAAEDPEARLVTRPVASVTPTGAEDMVRIPFSVAGAAPLFFGAGAPEAIERQPALALAQGLRFWGGLVARLGAEGHRFARVESHWLVPSSLAVACVVPGIPHRAHAHGGDVALLERLPGGASLARLVARRAREIVFASADLEARFARLLAGAATSARHVVRPAPVDATRFVPVSEQARRDLRRELGLDGPVVLGVGRLVPIKGWDLLLRAVGRLPGDHRPQVVLAGDGPEREALTALAATRGVSARFLGYVPPREVAQWMAVADVVVQPSRRLPNGRAEGTPLAVREALACGRPVIASATGGMAALAPTEPGLILVPPDDPGALSAALARR